MTLPGYVADEDTKPRHSLLNEAESQIERHPDQTYPVRVAPSLVEEDGPFSSIRAALMSVACWRLDDGHFDFDSSFILPKAAPDFRRLGTLREDYHESPMSIFGHADPVGSDTYNKKLSGNRARALFALLVRDLDAWEELFNEHGWGLRSTQIMLMHLDELEQQRAPAPPPDAPPPAPEEAPFQGPADGKDTAIWRNAVRRFQKANGLTVDGVAGKNTRRKLSELYMDVLAAKNADGSAPFKFDPADFLGKGQDPKGKAAYQGCSEFNPIILLSDEENKLIDAGPEPHQTRNQRNAPNRRVVLYFFPPGLQIEPSQWPCPRASEGPADCKKRFWSDHERRLKPDATLTRAYAPIPGQSGPEPLVKQDTFACRFYDRLARRSPCEAGFHEWIVQLLYPGEEALQKRPRVAGAKFVAEGSTGRTAGVTDENGVLRVRVRSSTETIQVTLQVPLGQPEREGAGGDASAQSSAPQAGTTTVKLTLVGGKLTELDDPSTRDQAVDDRLRSLGFGALNGPLGSRAPRDPLAAIDEFKKLEEIKDTDNFDEVLKDRYGS